MTKRHNEINAVMRYSEQFTGHIYTFTFTFCILSDDWLARNLIP